MVLRSRAIRVAFLRAARPIARPGAGEHARAARSPLRRVRRLCYARGLLGGSFQVFLKLTKSMEILKGLGGHISSVVLLFNIMISELRGQMICASSE